MIDRSTTDYLKDEEIMRTKTEYSQGSIFQIPSKKPAAKSQAQHLRRLGFRDVEVRPEILRGQLGFLFVFLLLLFHPSILDRRLIHQKDKWFTVLPLSIDEAAV